MGKVSKSILVIVMGLPGSGKSFFAKNLAKEIDAEYLGSDELRKELGLMGNYQLGNKLSVYEEMFNRAKKIQKSKKSLVLDGTFYLQQVRDLFLFLAKTTSWQCFIILVRAPEELIAKRLSKPRVDSEADLEVYKKIKSEFDPILEEHLVINSSDTNLNESLEKSLKYIKTNHGKVRSQGINA